MPRDPSGVYSIPPGTHGITNTTISSSAYNAYVDDVAQDLNIPRPIVAGGTGASTASAALANLGGMNAAGGVMTGNLNIAPAADAILRLIKPGSGYGDSIIGYTGDSSHPRWEVALGNGSVESGSNAGSNFVVTRYSDGNTAIDAPLQISRATGQVQIKGSVGAGANAGYVGELITGTYASLQNIGAGAWNACVGVTVTAGDWDIWGVARGAGGAGNAYMIAVAPAVNTVSGGLYRVAQCGSDGNMADTTPTFP